MNAAWLAPAEALQLGCALDYVPDAGGDRWALDGRPLHAGDAVELLTTAGRRWCSCREDESCARCGDARELVTAAWLPVRFEFWNDRGGPGARVYLVIPALVADGARPRVELDLAGAGGVRLRWPVT